MTIANNTSRVDIDTPNCGVTYATLPVSFNETWRPALLSPS